MIMLPGSEWDSHALIQMYWVCGNGATAVGVGVLVLWGTGRKGLGPIAPHSLRGIRLGLNFGASVKVQANTSPFRQPVQPS